MKLKILLITVGICLLLAGCKQAEASQTQIKAAPTLNPGLVFESTCVRADGCVDGVEYPVVNSITSSEQLDVYVDENEDDYQLDDAFVEAISAFDSEYFKQNMLVVVVLQEASSSAGHSVESLVAKDNGVIISIKRVVQAPPTDESASWHVIIEIEKEYGDCDFTVSLHDD